VNQKNLQKVPDPILKIEVCSELFYKNKSGFDDNNKMELEKLKEEVTKIFLNNLKRDNIEIDDNYLVLKLGEELGEFIQAYLIHKKKCRPEKYLFPDDSKKQAAKELADVIGLIFVIASQFDIDLEEAITKKWITREWVKKK
jgi:NTP pyrophosphatase (non-canonical NTP hydrolase)